jgi:hypothetical protein
LARAKHTTRAEARRRYRQSIAQSDALEGDATASDAGDATSATSARTNGGPPRSSGARITGPSNRSSVQAAPAPGLMGAFRGAYRPARYREDLAVLPQLVRGRWFLISMGLVVVGFAAWIVFPTTLTFFLLQTFTLPPAMIPIFLVGFTAPRASYLLGLVIGIADVVLYSLLVVTSPTLSSGVTIADVLFTSVAIGLPASVLFASGAAWYRRFLALSSGRRQTSSAGRGKAGAKAPSRR